MIEIFTSNFARSSKLPGAVAISRSVPYWWSDRRPRYLALAPEAIWLSLSDTDYDAHFNRLLEQLDAQTVITDLAKLVAPHPPAVLLCFESPGIRCHRRRVSQWIQSETGLVVPNSDSTTCRLTSCCRPSRSDPSRFRNCRCLINLATSTQHHSICRKRRATSRQGANFDMSRGQISKRGKSWQVRIFTGYDAAGKRLYYSATRKTKCQAEEHLTAKLSELDSGTFVMPDRTTLGEYLDRWLETIAKTRVAPQTYDGYEMLLRVHIRPHIGIRKLSDIRSMDIQQIYSKMQTAGLSPRTIRYAHSVLSSAMKQAVRWNLIARNPCEYVELPRMTRNETKAFSPKQAGEFLKAAKDDRHGVIFEFALATGCRPEEYLSLKWSDIDFERGAAAIQRALIWCKGGGFRFAETKTARSRRTVPLPVSLIPKLRHHRIKQGEHRLQLGPAYENHDLVFASEIGKPLHYRNLTQRHFEKILKEAGLDKEGFVLYSLRHSCATLLLAVGENPKVVAERLGHSSVKMTLDVYSHVLPDMQQSATEKLERMLYAK